MVNDDTEDGLKIGKILSNWYIKSTQYSAVRERQLNFLLYGSDQP